MFPYELVSTERERYEERLKEAEQIRRSAHMREDDSTLWDRTTFRLGDLLISAGEQLKQRHNHQTERRAHSAQHVRASENRR